MSLQPMSMGKVFIVTKLELSSAQKLYPFAEMLKIATQNYHTDIL